MIDYKLFVICLVCSIASNPNMMHGLSTDGCTFDSSCRPFELCDKSTFGLLGECIRGKVGGKRCMRDRECESKECSWFHCEDRPNVQNGPCKHSADCPDDQYCDDLEGRDDLRQCFDKICSGKCRKDSQCKTDDCSITGVCKASDDASCGKKSSKNSTTSNRSVVEEKITTTSKATTTTTEDPFL